MGLDELLSSKVTKSSSSSATITTSSTSQSSETIIGTTTSLSGLGNRWVWCQPLRGIWQVQYNQSQLISYLQQMSPTLIHRGIDQGGNTSDCFQNNAQSIASGGTVLQWIQALKAALPGVKIIGRCDATIGSSLGTLDPSASDFPNSTFSQQVGVTSGVPDLSTSDRQNLLINWGKQYYNYLGIDGIWFDIVNGKKLNGQSADTWNAVYNGIHLATDKNFVMQTNTSASLVGMRDAIEDDCRGSDIDMAAQNVYSDSIDWANVASQAALQNNGIVPPLTLHIDVPNTMAHFIGLTVNERIFYLTQMLPDSQKQGFIFEWPMLAGNPGGNTGYDSIADSTISTIVSLVNQL